MSSRPISILDRITALVLLVLSALVLAYLVLGQAWAEMPARAMALALLVVVIPRFGLREWVLLTLALILTFGLWQRPDGAGQVGHALGRGAYFTAFILLLMLLREAATTSPAVLRVGHWISHQPPGRRYTTTWIGGHLAGILMNFGAVSLLSPLIQRGVRADPIETPEDERRALIRERRQLSSLVRGFAPVITWAPTTLTQVIILAAVPGLNPVTAILYGLCLSAIAFVVGWTEDRLRWGPPRIAPAPVPFPGRAALDLLVVYTILIVGSGVLVWQLHLSLPQALMTVAPAMLVGWVTSQQLGQPQPLQHAARRIGEIIGVSIPRMARDAYLLGAAGYIGITAALLAPTQILADWLESAHVPAWVLVAALPMLITLGGQIALSPMMMVVFLASIVSALPELPTAPEHIAIALSAGWMLSLTASPNATGALLIAGATGIKATTITWIWNGRYSLVMMAVFTALSWAVVGA